MRPSSNQWPRIICEVPVPPTSIVGQARRRRQFTVPLATVGPCELAVQQRIGADPLPAEPLPRPADYEIHLSLPRGHLRTEFRQPERCLVSMRTAPVCPPKFTGHRTFASWERPCQSRPQWLPATQDHHRPPCSTPRQRCYRPRQASAQGHGRLGP